MTATKGENPRFVSLSSVEQSPREKTRMPNIEVFSHVIHHVYQCLLKYLVFPMVHYRGAILANVNERVDEVYQHRTHFSVHVLRYASVVQANDFPDVLRAITMVFPVVRASQLLVDVIAIAREPDITVI